MSTSNRVCAFAIATRLVAISLGILSYLWTGAYDSSADIQLASAPSLIHRCLNAFLRWDALYFTAIAQHGYVYEQQHAFFPFLPMLTRFLATTVLWPLHSVLGEQYTYILSGILITNVSFVLAARALYRLTEAVFHKSRLALLSAIAFSLSPPAMFMSSVYTEPVFAWLSFTGMTWYVQKRYFAASLVWALASLTRSNAIVYSGFFVYDKVLLRCINKSRIQDLVNGLISAVVYSAITVTGFAAFQYIGYVQFCVDSVERQPWCDRSIPLLYSYVQKHYWNNGLFAYYELKQIPNFLLAAPIILLSIAGISTYASYDKSRFWSLGFCSEKRSAKGSKPTASVYASQTAAPFIYLWGFLLVYATTCMHVQVIIRFFTSVPPLYWYTAELWEQGLCKDDKKGYCSANVVLSYFVLYGLVGIVLFAAFLPPA